MRLLGQVIAQLFGVVIFIGVHIVAEVVGQTGQAGGVGRQMPPQNGLALVSRQLEIRHKLLHRVGRLDIQAGVGAQRTKQYAGKGFGNRCDFKLSFLVDGGAAFTFDAVVKKLDLSVVDNTDRKADRLFTLDKIVDQLVNRCNQFFVFQIAERRNLFGLFCVVVAGRKYGQKHKHGQKQRDFSFHPILSYILI